MTLAHEAVPMDDDGDDVIAGSLTLQAIIRADAPGWANLPMKAITGNIADAIMTSPDAVGEPSSFEVLLTGDAAMQALNKTFRGKDAPTNVLAFPSGEERGEGDARFLGSLALGFETMAKEAAERGIPFADHATHLVLHGVLHLLGHDHGHEDEREAMEIAERVILERFGIADPY
ncbi:MAG: rRNA maturation RNase YbeY [Pseudomonadota bacterium]